MSLHMSFCSCGAFYTHFLVRLIDEKYIPFADESAAIEDTIIFEEEIGQLRTAMGSLTKNQKI